MIQGLGTCCRRFVLDSDLHRSKQHSTTKHRGPQWSTEVRDLSCARSSGSFDMLAALANRVAGSAQGARRQWHHVAGSRPSTCSASRQVAQVHVGTVRQQKHACSCTVALFAHCASCVPRGAACPSHSHVPHFQGHHARSGMNLEILSTTVGED